MEVYVNQRLKFLGNPMGHTNLIVPIITIETSIKVPSHDASPEIAEDYAIDVDHRNQFKKSFVSQVMRLRGEQLLDEAVHHPAALGFAWMKPCCAKNVYFLTCVGEI